MLPKSPSSPVGLIVIDSAASSSDPAAADLASADATLDQIFNWLARGARLETSRRESVFRRLVPGSGVPRVAPRRFDPLRPPVVAADCRGLDIQLARAARQLRRQLSLERSASSVR